jgi:hypothetical protein
MPKHNPAKAVEALDLVLESFAGGAHWTQGSFYDGHGNRCLVGTLRYVRRRHRIKGDGTGIYLADAIAEDVIQIITWRRWEDRLTAFNDNAKDFAEVRKLILTARAPAERNAVMDVSEVCRRDAA